MPLDEAESGVLGSKSRRIWLDFEVWNCVDLKKSPENQVKRSSRPYATVSS
jgi:hypothetical protein